MLEEDSREMGPYLELPQQFTELTLSSLTPIYHSLSWIRLPAWPGWWVILEKVLLGSAFPCQLSREVTGPGRGNEDWGVGVGLEPRERESHFSSGPCVSWVWTELSWIELCLVE